MTAVIDGVSQGSEISQYIRRNYLRRQIVDTCQTFLRSTDRITILGKKPVVLTIRDCVSQEFAHSVKDRGVRGALRIFDLTDDIIEAGSGSFVLEDIKDPVVPPSERYVFRVPGQFQDVSNQLLLVRVFLIELLTRPIALRNSAEQGG